MTTRSSTLARLTGLLVGSALCVALVVSGRVPESEGASGARVVMRSSSTGALAVEPAGRFLTSRELRPGAARGGARGFLVVESRSSARMLVRLRLVPASRDLDRLLVAEVRVGRTRVFRGRLGELRRWTERSFRLQPQQREKLSIEAWLPRSVRDGYESRLAQVELEWRVRAA